jgi:hypothetical protein
MCGVKLRLLFRRRTPKPQPEAERLLRLYRETHEDVRRIIRRAA